MGGIPGNRLGGHLVRTTKPEPRMPRLSLILLLTACSAGPIRGGPTTGDAAAGSGSAGEDAGTYDGTAEEPAQGELSFVDELTGSSFNIVGQAFDGPLADDKLQLGVLPGVTAFWFAWSTHWPGARVWPDQVNHDGVSIQGNDECGVPCEEMITACGGGQDCIPSIDDPEWTTPDDSAALSYLEDSDRVLGVRGSLGARAYPLDTLWTHEIVNDTWGEWEFSVAYCPLTASGMVIEGTQDGQAMRFGVSGRLFNSNLIMYDRTTDSLYGQMRQVGLLGERLGGSLDISAAVDTTWGAWKALFPDTEVLSGSVGTAGYPYGDYRTDHDDTFMANSPAPDPLYPNKSYAIGVTIAGETTIYPLEELVAQIGVRGIVEDEVGGFPVLVAFDSTTSTAVVLSRSGR